MSEQRAEDLTKSASAESGEPQPPASNQGKEEPVATSPSESRQSSDAGDVDDVRVNPPAPPGKPDGEVDTRA